jgi:hypothetical protein
MNQLGKSLFHVASASLLVVAAAGCGSQASTLCDLICECEHCSDLDEDATCTELEAEMDVAEAYECQAEWEDWATCVEEKGRCEEKDARYTTQEPGSCSEVQDTGFPCTVEGDCDAGTGPDSFCEAGTCKFRTCSGSGGTCSTNSDCQGGEDACGDQREDLAKCQADASDHPNPFTQEPPPEPGSTAGSSGGNQ